MWWLMIRCGQADSVVVDGPVWTGVGVLHCCCVTDVALSLTLERSYWFRAQGKKHRQSVKRSVSLPLACILHSEFYPTPGMYPT